VRVIDSQKVPEKNRAEQKSALKKRTKNKPEMFVTDL